MQTKTDRTKITIPMLLVSFLLITILAACGGSNTVQNKPTPTPTPTPTLPPTPTPGGPGQDLLNGVSQKLSTAKSLHGIFNITISGVAFNGTLSDEIWNVSPDKNRTVVLSSTLSQFPAGIVNVTDGKTIWQYDPVNNVVYTGSVSSTTGTPTATGTPTGGLNFVGGGAAGLIFSIVQSVFRDSIATLTSSSASINGHTAYQVHVVPRAQAGNSGGLGGISYTGDIYIDKQTMLPLEVDLSISGFGQITLDISTLELNKTIADSMFTFVIPSGAKVLPLQQANGTPGTTGTVSLAQAQQQAGYHLLSIPGSQTDYELNGVTVLGSPGNQIFTLNYNKGNVTFTITESKALANLPISGGQQLSLRGTTAVLLTANGAVTLEWTEKGVGIQITGKLSNDQATAIANLLS